jgi:hypothetical protein
MTTAKTASPKTKVPKEKKTFSLELPVFSMEGKKVGTTTLPEALSLLKMKI